MNLVTVYKEAIILTPTLHKCRFFNLIAMHSINENMSFDRDASVLEIAGLYIIGICFKVTFNASII